MTSRRVVVVGAGITGLAAAHRLVVDRPDLDVAVLEATERAGGKLVTSPFAGLDVDEGADAFLVRVPWAAELCAELGLTDRLVAPAARRASLWLDDALRPIPTPNVLGVPLDPTTVADGLLPADDLTRLAGSGRPDQPLPDGDLSVGRVIRACAGDAVFERLVDPLLGGVNAGDADRLSCTAMAPQLMDAARHPDGLLDRLRHLQQQADPSAPVFNAHPDGMVAVVDALVDRLGDRLHLGRAATHLHAAPGGWTVDTDTGPVDAAAVIMTVPSFAAAGLVAGVHPPAAAVLTDIEHASVVLTTLAYRRSDLTVPADQSGFLVPRTAGLLMTACSFAGSKWAPLDAGDHVLLRVSAGRSDDLRHVTLDDDDLIAGLRADLALTLGVEAPPVAARTSLWPRSLAQFPVGHPGRMADLAADLADAAPGLIVTGADHHGVGIPACIRSGSDAAAQVSQIT